ncbi:hypothetical protein BJY00DRAFT_286579 [Aspergillus carlsbadensis]|nr:hypothetical protein BJY00DRAFT_286579 [Aspergillus carlsbadensis]
MVMAIITQFFFIMALNGIWAHQKSVLASTKATRRHFGISLAYTCLCARHYRLHLVFPRILARNKLAIRSNVCDNLARELHLLHAHQLHRGDTPHAMRFVPFFVLTWVILSVSSTISPLSFC